MYTGKLSAARLPLALALTCWLASPALQAVEIEQRSLSAPEAAAKPAVAKPAATASTPPAKAVAAVAVNPAWDMFQQIEELRQSVSRLQGTVEEQQQLIERLQSDLRTRYTDLDQRMEQLSKPVPPAAVVIPAAPATFVPDPAPMPSPTPGEPVAVAPPAVIAPPATAVAPAPVPAPAEISPEELNRQKSAYLAAYQSFRRDGANPAITAMSRFLEAYPNSVFAPNAYYWLGEFLLAQEPANLMAAEANFQRVLRDYAASPKVASAYYKLGVIAEMQGKRKTSREWMTKVISQFPNSQEARLAQSFLEQNPAK